MLGRSICLVGLGAGALAYAAWWDRRRRRTASPSKCPCANCTCGLNCQCAPGQPGCDPCAEFQRQPKASATAPAAQLSCPVVTSADRTARSTPPTWWSDATTDQTVTSLKIDEWERGPDWRKANGWLGTDYIHGLDAAVHVPGYLLEATRGGVLLVGAAHFGAGAESHQGLCHGGAMTALMDDAIGWCGFCVSGTCEPWSGFTVQIDTSLKAPVQVSRQPQARRPPSTPIHSRSRSPPPCRRSDRGFGWRRPSQSVSAARCGCEPR